MREVRTAYLLELLHVDVELTAQLGFSVGKGGNLSTQCSTTGNLVLGQTTLLLVLAGKALKLCILVPHKALEVEFPKLILVEDGLQFVANAGWRTVSGT